MSSDAELTNYDSIAETFITHAGRPDSWNNLYERPYMLNRLPPLKDRKVLDIGCSTGFYTEYAISEGASVTAIDASHKMIDRIASRNDSPKLTLHCADISQPIPFLESESFDLVIASLVLDYIKDWNALFDELYRVLKKKGSLHATFCHPLAIYLHVKPESYYDFKMVEDVWGRDSDNPFKTHYYIRPLSEMFRSVLQSKFRIEAIEEMQPGEELKKRHPELYKQLITRTGFMYVRLVKATG